MAVVRTIQGYVLPDSGLRRFSVRKTAVFSWALPTTMIPSDLLKRDRYSWVTSSLRWPLVNVIKGICSRLAKRSTAAMNDLLMGFISRGCDQLSTMEAEERGHSAVGLESRLIHVE